jgi:SWI/SNF-related matrix-associated actin-dependent regulator 1 of chromatin subfamily A
VENVKVLESRNRQRSDECFEQNQFVYCLEIADNHNFFADGVLVSNCQYIRAIKGVKRVKYFKELCQGVPHVLALSGTPLVNRPAELWNVINLLRPDVFDSWVDFAPRYCAPRLTRWGLVYDGAENLDELNQRLVSSCMIRRLKSEVLTDLPPKSRFVVPLPLEKPKEYQLAKTDFLKWLAQVNPKKVKRAKRALALVKLNYLLQLAAKLKLNSVFEWIDNFLEDSVGKILLFCTHKNTLDLLVDRYKDQCVFIDGSVSGTKRQLAVDQFQNNKKTRVFVGNVVAAGTGLTLTAASTVAFVELDWVPANMTQCEDRVHRIGQKNNVQIYYLVAHNTIEEKLCEILQDKQKVLDAVLDGKIDGSGTLDVYDELERELHRSFSV